MKSSVLTIALLFFAFAIIANTGTTIRLIHSDKNSSTLEFIPGSYKLNSVNTPVGVANTITIDKGSSMLVKGEPDLVKLTTTLVIPDLAEMEVDVASSNYYDIPNINIAPSKGNLYRSINPSEIPYTYGATYSKNDFFPASIASLDSPYILRDFRGQVLQVCPFQYNPQTNVLRVYTSIIITVSVKSNNGINQLKRTSGNSSLIDKEFESIYKKQFLNYSPIMNSRSVMYNPVSENGSMLVICYDAFSADIQPFVTWKNQKGIATELVLKSVAGATSAAIKSFINNYYSIHPNLKYVLLVGDAAQIPASSTSAGDSDNDYGYLAGNDSYPEVFIGRFSATTSGEIQTMVNRTLNYERLPQANGLWYKKGIAIGSSQGPGDNNEYDWEHERIIAGKLLAYTYASENEYYDGSRGGSDSAFNPTPANITSSINDGVGIITYTGHGSDFAFTTSGFSVNDINSGLTNTNTSPFIWSVACVEGNFVANPTCFAEAWLRAGTPSQPKGALSVLMSTINQSWDPPMNGQDAMVDILVESSSTNIKRSFGGLSMNGCMQMNDTYGSQGTEMTDTWTLFGDPSVMVFTDTPAPMAVSHISIAPVGTTAVTVNCNVIDALVCLSMNGVILGTGISNGSTAVITIPAVTSGIIDVTATAFNKMPYFGTIQVGTTGLMTNDNAVRFTVYPVPVNNTLNIACILTKSDGLKISLFNTLGQEIMVLANEETPAGSFNKAFDISALSSGVYFCKLEQGNFVTTERVIIQK